VPYTLCSLCWMEGVHWIRLLLTTSKGSPGVRPMFKRSALAGRVWCLFYQRPHLIPLTLFDSLFQMLFSSASLCLRSLLTAATSSAHSVYPWGRRRLPSLIASLLHRPCHRNSQPTTLWEQMQDTVVMRLHSRGAP